MISVSFFENLSCDSLTNTMENSTALNNENDAVTAAVASQPHIEPIMHAAAADDNGIKSLESWFYFAMAILGSLWLLALLTIWQFSIASMLFLIPLCILIRWWNKNRTNCTLNHILKQYFYGFASIALMAFFLQFIAIILITLTFGILGAFSTSSYTAGWFIYIIICVGTYVFIEELFKLSFNIKAFNEVENVRTVNKTHTMASTATSLGYASSTGLTWLLFAALSYLSQLHYIPVGWLILDGLIIGVIGMPMHLMTGYFIGLKITQVVYARNDENNNNNNVDNSNPQQVQAQVQAQAQAQDQQSMETKENMNFLTIPCIARGTYIFMLVLGLLVLPLSLVGTILIILAIVLEYCCLTLIIKKEEKKLPFDYLERAGYLNVFGYGALLDEEDDQIDPYDRLKTPTNPSTGNGANNSSTNQSPNGSDVQLEQEPEQHADSKQVSLQMDETKNSPQLR